MAVLDRDKTIRTENVPGDSGGTTFAGIDRASHEMFNFEDPTPDEVITEYLLDWYGVCAHKMPVPVGETVANFGVNRGDNTAVKMLQIAINEQTNESVDVDGEPGPITLGAIDSVKDKLKFALSIVNIADGQYRSLAKRSSRYRQFLNGWLNRDRDLVTFDKEDFKTYA